MKPSNVINIDFKRRMVISGPSTEATARDLTVQNEESQDIFSKFDYTIQCMEARFGDELPPHGPIYKQSLKTAIFDSYGYGNCHDSIHQYRPSDSKNWNRPIPFPADLRAIDTYLKKNKGKVLRLGNKSDPFMWMDHRYQITKSILTLANEYGVHLVIYTISDLCAQDDYLDLIKTGKHTIKMQMGFTELVGKTHSKKYGFGIGDAMEEIERSVSPGAPSIKRRQKAIDKLRESGVEVRPQWSSLTSLNKTQQKEFEKRTGTTVGGWIGDEK